MLTLDNANANKQFGSCEAAVPQATFERQSLILIFWLQGKFGLFDCDKKKTFPKYLRGFGVLAKKYGFTQ